MDVIEGVDRGNVTEAVSRFREAVQEKGLPAAIRANVGVSVGQLYDAKADPVIEALRQLNGLDLLRDDDMIPMRVPFAGSEILDGKVASGIVQTAGAILDVGLSEEEKTKVIGRQVSNVRKVYEGFLSLASDPAQKQALNAAKLGAALGQEGSTVKKAFETFQAARSKAPLALGILGIGAIASHFKNKQEENRPFNETFYEQDKSDRRYKVADLLQMKMDAGVDLSFQRYDPLSTAFVVDNLDSNKIGHTSMAWDKNSSLYGGII